MKQVLILGRGQTGQSVQAFCLRQAWDYQFFDPQHDDVSVLNWADVRLAVVSPGVPLDTEVVQVANTHGVEVIGDIELFARHARAPIIGITGTNGKSTVTTLLNDMINATAHTAVMGGNIGIPVLDLLAQPIPDYYVLELSSFQLESTFNLNAKVGVLLNISDDHLNRHGTMAAYRAAKMRLLEQSEISIDKAPEIDLPALSSSLDSQHNRENVRFALGVIEALELPAEKTYQVLKSFKSLPHRCEKIAEANGIAWVDDSKATNVGAAVSAINSLGQQYGKHIVLIAGGQGKAADFTPLVQPVQRYVKALVLIGEDRGKLQSLFAGMEVACSVVDETGEEAMQLIVSQAGAMAQPGDVVLLAPACASFDMFQSFGDRGERFAATARGWRPHPMPPTA